MVGKPSFQNRAKASSRSVRSHSGPCLRWGLPSNACSQEVCFSVVVLKFFSNFHVDSMDTVDDVVSVCRLDNHRIGFNAGISAVFQFESQFLAAAFHHASVNQHMHEVGHNVVQEALVMRDDQE